MKQSIFLALLVLVAAPVSAGVVKCKGADGSVTYTENSCPPGTRNMDLPAEATAPPPGSSTASGEPLSRKATMLKQQMDICLENSADAACTILEATASMCRDKANWNTPNCVAFKQAAEATREKIIAAEKNPAMDPGCANGNSYACIQNQQRKNADCNHSLNEGSDVDARACAQRLNMPSAATWVLMGESKS
ncbi:MAG: DUF4124 domain-containing protein, partial [Rhizobacter sp.]